MKYFAIALAAAAGAVAAWFGIWVASALAFAGSVTGLLAIRKTHRG